MDIATYVQGFIHKTDSPEKVYELFRVLKYQKDKVLDPTYLLPDRKALDDIVFDILGLTEDEWNKVYRRYVSW